MTNQQRKQFRDTVYSETSHTCIVPWCEADADDAHHVIERALWEDGGYIPANGAAVCNHHHQAAEANAIPPQAFWLWKGISEPRLPTTVDSVAVDKWGTEFDTPPWKEHRDRIKYPSSRHLLPLYWHDPETCADSRTEHDDTGLETLEAFVGQPLVVTHKIDGSNCMLVSDVDSPVRARNGKTPLETMERLYGDNGLYWQQRVHEKLPDRLQVFGEWTQYKHSIHYGCDCDDPCDDIGPQLGELTDVTDDRAYFQVFGVYDTTFDLWLSWPETQSVAAELGFPTVPVLYCEDAADTPTFETVHDARQTLITYARDVIANGGEGIVVRSKYPFHYDQFSHALGKYVRENHVTDDSDHWRTQHPPINNI